MHSSRLLNRKPTLNQGSSPKPAQQSAFSTTRPKLATAGEGSSTPGIPYANLTIGVPLETFPNERRVAIAPQNVSQLRKKGFKRVLIEKGAGVESSFTDQAFQDAGATIIDAKGVWGESDILLKVRPPNIDSEVPLIRSGSTLISFLYPAINKPLVDALAGRGTTAFAMDMIPRISRAQGFDALSSMANIAGYKAVLEASNHFGR